MESKKTNEQTKSRIGPINRENKLMIAKMGEGEWEITDCLFWKE